MERWKAYFESLLNEENPRKVSEDGVANLGVTREVAPGRAVKRRTEGEERQGCRPRRDPS